MKRKSIILLSSILAGSLLVGGAFAAYAVTDNADPFGINVTPGNLDEDDTQYVTLEWGATTNLEGVGLLKVGENRKVGVVSLVSTPTHDGKFSLSITDHTDETEAVSAARTDYLLDYLNVKVYAGSLSLKGDGSLPDGTPVAEITKSTTVKKGHGGSKSLNFEATGTTAGAEYSIFLTLDDSASPVFAQMGSDKVRLEVDWGKKDGDETATGKIVYFAKPSGWAGVYAYAWKGDKVNAAYPGVEMAKSYNEGLYQILVPTDMENLIFNDGTGNDEKKTADLTFTGYDSNNSPYWNGTTWAAKPDKQEVSVISATVNGEPVELTDVKPTESTDKGNYKITLAANDVVIFKDGNTTVHFYHWDGTQSKVVDDGTNYVATVAGEHTFYYNSNSEMYVGLPEQEVIYYVVGKLNGVDSWTSTAYPLVRNTACTEAIEYMLEDPIALKVGDGVKVRSSTGTYYPETEGNEFVITDTEGWGAGNYQVYFRPAGNSDWGTPHYLTLAKQA